MREHAPRWLRVRIAAADGRSRTTAASARIAGPGAAGTGPTTSSSRNLHPSPRARSRRQPEDSNEARRIFLIVAIAHSERRKIGAIERMFGLPAHDRYVSFIQRQRHTASHLRLRAGDKGVQRLAQRCKPQSEVDELRVLQRHMLLEVRDLALQAERFQLAMRRDQQRPPWRFITPA